MAANQRGDAALTTGFSGSAAACRKSDAKPKSSTRGLTELNS